jgi:hypothetical protein
VPPLHCISGAPDLIRLTASEKGKRFCADAQVAIAPRNLNGAAQDGDQHGPVLSEQSMPLGPALSEVAFEIQRHSPRHQVA